MSAPDQSREPCPDRILDDMGGAFGMGAVGGSVFHFIKGLKNSPNGERLAGGVQAVRMNAPRVGGSFAVWGGLFSVFDCSMVYIRKKEDPWNPIFAGAATGGFLQMRHGLKSASRSAMFGGVLLALIEGAGLMINRVLASMPQQLPPPQFEQPMGLPSGAMYGGAAAGALGAPSAGANASAKSETPSESETGWRSWTGGWFGGKKEEASSSPSYDGLSSFPSTSSGNEGLSSVLSSSSNESSSAEKKEWKSWTGGFFGGKKEESTAPASESLGSFETSSGPVMPTFDYK